MDEGLSRVTTDWQWRLTGALLDTYLGTFQVIQSLLYQGHIEVLLGFERPLLFLRHASSR